MKQGWYPNDHLRQYTKTRVGRRIGSCHLGAITGLSADIFASLDDGGYGTGGVEAPQRLTMLLDEYGSLQSQLGHVQAYQDVGEMLTNMEWSALSYWEQPRPVREGPGTSGYSP